MSTLTQQPSPAIKALTIRLVAATGQAQPHDVLSASTNHLVLNIFTLARLDGKSRGETKHYARGIADDIVAAVMSNFDQQT